MLEVLRDTSSSLIDTYNLLYLEPIRFLPASMQEPLNATTRQALSPRVSPPPLVN